MRKNEWNRLAARTRCLPFLMGRPRVRYAGYDVELVDGLRRWVYAALALLVALACAALLAHELVRAGYSADPIGGSILGALVLVSGTVALYFLCRVNRIRCLGGGGGLRLTHGILFWNSTETLEPDEAGACIRLLEKGDTLSGTKAGHAALALLRAGEKARRIRIAIKSTHSALRKSFQELKKGLGGRGVDHTVTDVTLPGGETLRMSRACRGSTFWASGLGMGVVSVRGEGRRKTATVWKSNIGGAALMAMGAAPVLPITQGVFDVPDALVWVAWASLGLFLALATALLAGFGSRCLTIDTGRDLLLAGRYGFGARQYAVRNVAAVQVCSRWLGRYRHPVWRWRVETKYVYQIFVVLRTGSSRRLFVQDTTHRDGVFYDARRLAAILDVPLLDHTVNESE